MHKSEKERRLNNLFEAESLLRKCNVFTRKVLEINSVLKSNCELGMEAEECLSMFQWSA